MSDPVRLALAQIPIKMGDKDANVAAALRAVEAAADRHCDLVVLPECVLGGWMAENVREVAEYIPGAFVEKLQHLAIARKIAIVAGVEEHLGGRIFNSAVFISENGERLLVHRKINELEAALGHYNAGTTLAVTEWRGRKLALLICADCWRPELVDAVHLMGASLIVSPSAWAVEPGGESTNLSWITEIYRQRAQGRDLTIAAANSVGTVTHGPWKGRVLQGNSVVYTAFGTAIGNTSEPDLVVATV